MFANLILKICIKNLELKFLNNKILDAIFSNLVKISKQKVRQIQI